MKSRKHVASVLAISTIAAALMLSVFATAAPAALRHFDGTVVAKNATARTFQITTQSGSKKTFKVNANTEFERIAGSFGGLHKGLQIEVDAVTSQAGLVARQVEPQGGGGGDDSGGHGDDDGPNHT